MQKTQLTVLIEEIDKTIDNLKGMDAEYDKGQKDVYIVIRDIAIEMLSKEKEDMENAYSDGFRYARAQVSKIIKTGDHDPKEKVITEHKYFDTNYLQYKP